MPACRHPQWCSHCATGALNLIGPELQTVAKATRPFDCKVGGVRVSRRWIRTAFVSFHNRHMRSMRHDRTDHLPRAPEGLFAGSDGALRCAWCRSTPAYQLYHDKEWGFPVTEDRRLFEKLCLEGFQAGLSWLTILNKREAFRRAFAEFEVERVARFDELDVARLLNDAAIVRHRGKIESTINNARRLMALNAEFGSLANFVWRFEPEAATRPRIVTHLAAKGLTASPESVALAKDLKKRGWTFVGPITVYAFMQAMGLVNDHIEGCHARSTALRARAERTGLS